MHDYLILKLQGVMQAWGEHTFEGLRPSTNFPTRSALVGLLGACLGIDRNDRQKQQSLANSIGYAARQDTEKPIWNKGNTVWKDCNVIKMIDYHTVKDARADYVGLKSLNNTIITKREYLYDASFTLAIWSTDDPGYTLDHLQEAVIKPRYTPFLGRRSCPISRPLFEDLIQAMSADEALKMVEPSSGIIYSEEVLPDRFDVNVSRHRVRDVPIPNQPRQFASRMVSVYGREKDHVSK